MPSADRRNRSGGGGVVFDASADRRNRSGEEGVVFDALG
jgi:hypothetical protein